LLDSLLQEETKEETSVRTKENVVKCYNNQLEKV